MAVCQMGSMPANDRIPICAFKTNYIYLGVMYIMDYLCAACKKQFDRMSRLFNHIPKDKDCALNTGNILLLSDKDQRSVLLDIHAKYFEFTSRKYDMHAYRQVRKILIDVKTTEETRLAALQDAHQQAQEQKTKETTEYIEKLESEVLVMKNYIETLESEAVSIKQELVVCSHQRACYFMGFLFARLNSSN